MKTNDAGIALIRKSEGERLVVYIDSAGYPTVGVGHLVTSSDNLKVGDTITQDQSDKFLRDDLRDAEQAVERLVKVPLNENQFSALVSFTFNLGWGNLKSSTLLKRLNAYNYQGAALEFGKWIYAGGEKLDGLVKRREAERQLFIKPTDIYGDVKTKT